MNVAYKKFLCALLFFFGGACVAMAQESQGVGDLDAQIQTIKQQALELNRDLLSLEEELLFPADSRLTIYLSMDAGSSQSLEAVKLSINGTQVTHYLYTERQLAALRQGGLQRLYMGNVRAGNHEVAAVLIGRDSDGTDYQREARLDMEKTSGAKNLELKVTGAGENRQLELTVQEW